MRFGYACMQSCQSTGCHMASTAIVGMSSIRLPQDVVSFATSLPRLPCELDVLVVRKEGDQSHRDFRFRRAVVEWALIGYSTITHILPSLPNTSQSRCPGPWPSYQKMVTSLASHQFHQIQIQQNSKHNCPNLEDPYGTHLSQSFVHNAVRPIIHKSE